MGQKTDVSWCHHTFNAWWGCTKISPGCKNCYAEAWDHRMGGEHWGDGAPRRFFGDKHWAQPLAWNRAAAAAGERRRVFCSSMADVAEDRDDLVPHRARLFELIRATPSLDWLLLTKRPENLPRFGPFGLRSEPWPNVWLGTTVEDDHPDRARRLADLQIMPAVLRFLSMEPLLEEVRPSLDGIGWVIAGCESGDGKRAARAQWFRTLRDHCGRAGVPFFLKQADPETAGRGYPSGRAAQLVVIGGGAGAKAKRDGVITQPYLDGRQHLAFPEVRL
jgi:protein gp37